MHKWRYYKVIGHVTALKESDQDGKRASVPQESDPFSAHFHLLCTPKRLAHTEASRGSQEMTINDPTVKLLSWLISASLNRPLNASSLTPSLPVFTMTLQGACWNHAASLGGRSQAEKCMLGACRDFQRRLHGLRDQGTVGTTVWRSACLLTCDLPGRAEALDQMTAAGMESAITEAQCGGHGTSATGRQAAHQEEKGMAGRMDADGTHTEEDAQAPQILLPGLVGAPCDHSSLQAPWMLVVTAVGRKKGH
ncbi:uncharacterized protein RBU33_008211 [Hipposideros larvatus]